MTMTFFLRAEETEVSFKLPASPAALVEFSHAGRGELTYKSRRK